LSRYYGDNAADLGSGVYGLYAGDANGTEFINSADYMTVKPKVGLWGYYNEDCNLSGFVNSVDYMVIKPNVGEGSSIP